MHTCEWMHVYLYVYVSSVQSLSGVWLFVTPWNVARQVSLSITNSRSLLKLMSIESVMPSNHHLLCRPLLLLPSIFPSLKSFPMNQLFTSGGPSIGVSASASVLPMNIQDWSPLGWTGWIYYNYQFIWCTTEFIHIIFSKFYFLNQWLLKV